MMEKLRSTKDDCISEWGKENLKTIKKKDLMKLINSYIMEISVYYDEFDYSKNLCKSLSEKNSKINLACQQLKHQIANLKKVIEIYKNEEQACRREKKFVAPRRVKRSVGLQLRSDQFDSNLSTVNSGTACKIILPSNSILESLKKCSVRSSTEENSSSSQLESGRKSRTTCNIIFPSNSLIKPPSSTEANTSSACNGFAVPPPFPVIVSDVGELKATNEKLTPSQPHVKVKIGNEGKFIVVSWNMTLSQDTEAISHYDVYGYKEAQFLNEYKWKLIGSVKALPLPMAITLGQLQQGFHYHFCVRAVDIQDRSSEFSDVNGIKFDGLDIS